MELGSAIGLLFMYVMVGNVGVFVELLSVGMEVSLTLGLFLGLISSYSVALI